MSGPLATPGPVFSPLNVTPRSEHFVPRLQFVPHQSPRILADRPARPPPLSIDTPRDDITEISSAWSDSVQTMVSAVDMQLNRLPFSSRVLLSRKQDVGSTNPSHNVLLRPTQDLHYPTSELERPHVDRAMAAHAAQQRVLKAELAALQQSLKQASNTGVGSSSQHPHAGGASTATAVDFTNVMQNPGHPGQASNGKYFVSPFNRHRPRLRPNPTSAAPLPSDISSSEINGGGARNVNNSPAMPKPQLPDAPSRSSISTVANTSGLHVQTGTSSTSPSLKLRKTPTGGLKLQPVSNSHVNSALSNMKTSGGKPVRVKVQLKVKLPPLKNTPDQNQPPLVPTGSDAAATAGAATGPLQDLTGSEQQKVVKLKAKRPSPNHLRSVDSPNHRFSSLRKIDLVFAGERASSRASSASNKSERGIEGNSTLVLRCADGTLCKVPVGGTQSLQQLVATRDTILGEEGTSGFLNKPQQPYPKSCLKKTLRGIRSIRLVKKRVRFAPDTVEVNRESKDSQLQPTVKIGSQLYRLKLPSIKSVERMAPNSTGEQQRYTVKSVSLRPKNQQEEYLMQNSKDSELQSIQESEEDGKTLTPDSGGEDYSSVGSQSPASPAPPRNTSRAHSSNAKYTDMVMSIAMKKKKSARAESKTPNSSPTTPTSEGRIGSRGSGVLSPSPTPARYVVSKVQDRWKVTIKNS